MSFRIFTDTSSNLPEGIAKKYGIGVVPFSLYLNGEEVLFNDDGNFDGDEFYKSLTKNSDLKTSLINEQRFIDYFEPVLKNGEDILYIGMSSGISGAFCASLRAVEALKESYADRKIICVDTLAASLGEGLLVLTAQRLKEIGLTAEEVARLVIERRDKICQYFTVDDLAFLKKGGRISGATAIMGTVLQIKPILKGNNEGKIVSDGKARGRTAAIKALADKYAEKVVDAKNQSIGIAHAGCPEDAQRLADMINKSNPPREIITVCYEPVTGSHVGPGTLALFFTSDKRY